MESVKMASHFNTFYRHRLKLVKVAGNQNAIKTFTIKTGWAAVVIAVLPLAELDTEEDS